MMLNVAYFHDDAAETVPPTQFPAEFSDDVQSFNNFLQFDTDDFKSTMTTVATQAFKPLQEELLEELPEEVSEEMSQESCNEALEASSKEQCDKRLVGRLL